MTRDEIKRRALHCLRHWSLPTGNEIASWVKRPRPEVSPVLQDLANSGILIKVCTDSYMKGPRWEDT